MTGYTVHTGTTKKFSEGWDRVFSRGKSSHGKPVKAKKRTTSRKAGKRKSK